MVGGPSPAVAAALMFAALALSGCLGGDDAGPAGSGGDAPATADVRADAPVERPARIDGLAVDDATAPLAGVRVSVQEPALGLPAATTDAQGRFSFQGLPNGTYVLRATKTGYEFASASFALAAGQAKSVTLTMKALAVESPLTWNTTLLEGNLACGVQSPRASQNLCSSAPSTTGDRTEIRFELPAGVRGVVAEFAWAKNAENGATRLFANLDARGPGGAWREMNESSGTSPIVLRIVEGERGKDEQYPPEHREAPVLWRVIVTTTSSVVAPELVRNQAWQAHVTAFFGDRPPQNFTALP